jgi:hypothetical protein
MNGVLAVIIFGAVGYFIWFAIVGAGKSLGKKRSCPRCNKYGMKAKGTGYYSGSSPGRKLDWECPFCGHRFTT